MLQPQILIPRQPAGCIIDGDQSFTAGYIAGAGQHGR